MTGIAVLGGLQFAVLLALAVGAFGLSLWALIDAVRHPAGAYVSAGKRTKTFWVALTAVAAAIAFASLPLYGGAGLPGFLVILSVVAAAVYLADVRPAVRQFGGRRGGGSGRGGNQGPYGPW